MNKINACTIYITILSTIQQNSVFIPSFDSICDTYVSCYINFLLLSDQGY